jgi:prolyl 4-hydroxylase
MGITDEIQQLAQTGKPREAIALVERRAAETDVEAMFVLANWRLWGLYGPKDLAEAHRLLDGSARAGWGESALLQATLINNGTGCAADPAAARAILEHWKSEPAAAEQLALLNGMKEKTGWAGETLAANPLIRMIRGFWSPAECDYVLRRAEPELRPSMIIDQATGRSRPHPVRTSFSMNFGPADEDLVIHALNRRFAGLTATDPAAGEPLHVLRYTPGQEFRPHLDAIAGATNQRQYTAIVYLNGEFEGGETEFPELGIRTVGRKGDCLLFRNCDEGGNPDPRARHAGLPVATGAKWVASRWIRQHAYDPEMATSY